MTLDQLSKHGLDRRFGYKVKRNGKDRVFFQFNPLTGAWKSLLISTPIYLTDKQVEKILEYEVKRLGGEITVFACCCQKCATPENRQSTSEMFTKGIEVSHGLWPSCEKEEIERFEKGMKELNK